MLLRAAGCRSFYCFVCLGLQPFEQGTFLGPRNIEPIVISPEPWHFLHGELRSLAHWALSARMRPGWVSYICILLFKSFGDTYDREIGLLGKSWLSTKAIAAPCANQTRLWPIACQFVKCSAILTPSNESITKVAADPNITTIMNTIDFFIVFPSAIPDRLKVRYDAGVRLHYWYHILDNCQVTESILLTQQNTDCRCFVVFTTLLALAR